MNPDHLVEIFFRFYSDILDEETTETVQGKVVEAEYGYFKLVNIPFYVPKLAVGDVVWAEHSKKEGLLTYRKTVQSSGNSTIHTILLDDEYDIDAIIGVFEELGCESRKMNDQYFAIDVPAKLDYVIVKRRLDELEQEKVIDYAESCLSDKHQYKDISFS